MIVGKPPIDLGFVDVTDPTLNEHMIWLYCPIKVPFLQWFVVPPNLRKFMPLVKAVSKHRPIQPREYVYITAKTKYVSGSCIGQRPGWHTDGFGSDDINFIWYTNNPTEFALADEDELGLYEISDDHNVSMQQIEEIANSRNPPRIVTYPSRHLLKLDQSVMHRPAPSMEPGIRTFVKISISKEWYNLEGNSVNHELLDWGLPLPLEKRSEHRNHPVNNGQ